jgi:hypothetical protein
MLHCNINGAAQKIKPIFNDVNKLCAHGLGNALNLPKFVW